MDRLVILINQIPFQLSDEWQEHLPVLSESFVKLILGSYVASCEQNVGF